MRYVERAVWMSLKCHYQLSDKKEVVLVNVATEVCQSLLSVQSELECGKRERALNHLQRGLLGLFMK